MPRESKTQDWTGIVEAYAARSCSRHEFCEQQGITLNMLQYHLAKSKKRKSKFTPLSIEKPSSSEVSLQFPNGLTLIIRS